MAARKKVSMLSAQSSAVLFALMLAGRGDGLTLRTEARQLAITTTATRATKTAPSGAIAAISTGLPGIFGVWAPSSTASLSKTGTGTSPGLWEAGSCTFVEITGGAMSATNKANTQHVLLQP
jgi:hypothetical protein